MSVIIRLYQNSQIIAILKLMQSMPLQTLYSKETRSLMQHEDKVIESMKYHCKVSLSSPFVKSQMHLIGVSLRRRANARNVSFRISLRQPIYIVNSLDKSIYEISHISVDKTKLSCNTLTDAAPQFLWKLTPLFWGNTSLQNRQSRGASAIHEPAGEALGQKNSPVKSHHCLTPPDTPYMTSQSQCQKINGDHGELYCRPNLTGLVLIP